MTVLITLSIVGGGGSVVLAATNGNGVATVGTVTGGDSVAVQADNETTTDGENETTTELGDVPGTTTALGDATVGSARVRFENQTSNGTVVVVNRAILPEGGFITVHIARNVTGNFTENVTADMKGERVGNSTFLDPGTYSNVTIQLDQTLNESQLLIAEAHRDTNNNEQFDPAVEHAATTTPAEGAEETTTAAAEQVDAAYVVNGNPVMDAAFVRIVEDGGAAVETTTVANGTTTEAA